jgi:hypothetical protein
VTNEVIFQVRHNDDEMILEELAEFFIPIASCRIAKREKIEAKTLGDELIRLST